MAKCVFYPDKVQRKYTAAMRNAAKWTAIDVRRDARKSMKKRPVSKSSPPGTPPFAHCGGLKNAIFYAQESPNTWVVGPASGGPGAAATLERGGIQRLTKKIQKSSYLHKPVLEPGPKSHRLLRCPKHGTPRDQRPTKVGMGRSRGRGSKRMVHQGRDYRYFYSRQEWEAASRSPAFRAWVEDQYDTIFRMIRIAPRPYMTPALQKNVAADRLDPRLKRAFAKFW